MNASEIETKVQDATGNEAWGASGTTLLEIASATENEEERSLIQGVLFQRLRESGPNWRQCYKALNIIDYCIKNGSERLVSVGPICTVTRVPSPNFCTSPVFEKRCAYSSFFMD
jgi:hypothetical protein